MPRTMNGTGTTWYGNALPGRDGSVVVTEWVVIFAVPLIPLGSKRILWDTEREQKNKAKSWWKRDYNVGYYRVQKVPLYLPHLLKGYAITLPVVLFLIWCR